jgi:glycosyltransferase involved in cell wall biosynthesis
MRQKRLSESFGLLAVSEPCSIADALIRMLVDHNLRTRMENNGFKLAKKHRWREALESYAKAYEAIGLIIQKA